MENKQKNQKINFLDQLAPLILSFLIIIYFFYGFYTNENSAGAGGFEGDFSLIWNNLNLLRGDILSNLDNPLYSDSRPPLSYILHLILNPFNFNEEVFRTSCFVLSLTIPALLYFAIIRKYPELEKRYSLILALIITLSPYFRTTAYWSLGENYGLIFVILTYIFYLNLVNQIKTDDDFKKILWIFFLCFSSSLAIYFDQKLIFLPVIVLFIIFNLKISIKIKIFSLIFFSLFALPYIYLIFTWGAIIPTSAAQIRGAGYSVHPFNIGFCLSMLAFYIFPFLICRKIQDMNFKKLFNIKILILFLTFVIYLFSVFWIGDYENLRNDGKGIFHKLSILLFEDLNYRLIFTVLIFLISFFLIILFLKSKNDVLLILYFLVLSLVTFPFYQEYLDPLLFILFFTFVKTDFYFDKKRIYFLVSYFFIFLIGSKIYYNSIL